MIITVLFCCDICGLGECPRHIYLDCVSFCGLLAASFSLDINRKVAVYVLRFCAAAVRAIKTGDFNTTVALRSPDTALVPLGEALGIQKRVLVDGDTVLTARDLGICFGD